MKKISEVKTIRKILQRVLSDAACLVVGLYADDVVGESDLSVMQHHLSGTVSRIVFDN